MMTELCEQKSASLTATSLSDLTFVAFDVETTGLSAIACKLVELSGVKFTLASPEVETFTTLIDPGEPIPTEVSKLHGITDVIGAPAIEAVLPGFYTWCGDSIMIAHNAAFDVEFLKVHTMRQRLSLPPNAVVCTLALAQNLVPESLNHKLKTLSEHFGFGGSLYHRALDDSLYVHKLFAKLIEVGKMETFGHLEEHSATFSFTQSQQYPPIVLSEQLQTYLNLIKRSIERSCELKLTYSSAFKSTRVVLPLAVIESRGSIYLTALCRKSQAERTFRLDRIVEVTVHSV